MFWPGALAFGFPGVLGPYWQDTFKVGRGATGAIMFFVLASLGIFMFLVGRWQQRLGPRMMMTIGAMLCGVALVILAFATDIYMVYVWGFLNGTASCFTYMPALTVVQRWYPARRGLVSGIVNLVFGSAAALMVPLFGLMLVGLGYRAMNLVIAASALVFGVLVAQIVSLPPAPATPRHATAPAGSGSSPVRVPGLPTARTLPARSLTVAEGLRSRNFWLIWLVWAFQGAAGIAMVTLSVNFGIYKGFELESAIVILTAFNLTNGLSRILTGYFSDRIRRNLTMGVTFAAAAAAYFALPHVEGLAAAAVLAAVVGFGFGTLFAVSAPLAADCFGMDNFGAIFGLVFTAYGFIAGLLGPTLAGVLVDAAGGGYTVVFSYLGALCLVAAVLIQFVKPGRDDRPVRRPS
jgi:OFA family oxalate/formate antiporter-like MFS transporter